jgi:hypothetical protein
LIWTPLLSGKQRWKRCVSFAAIQVRPTLKAMFGIPHRQTIEFGERLLHLVALYWGPADFSTLCRDHKTLDIALAPTCNTSSAPKPYAQLK